MRKFLLLTVVAVLISGTAAMAAEMGPGCGPGKVVFNGKKGMLFQNLAWTTNYFGLPWQWFAITSGTSGCNADSVILRENEQRAFVASNFERLSQDMAEGHGEYVDAMADLMGCQPSVRPAFARMAQERYGEIFTGHANAKSVLANMKHEINARPRLASRCTRVS